MRHGFHGLTRICCVGFLALLCGCEEQPTSGQPKPLAIESVTELEPGTPRFKVVSHGSFKAGFDNSKREILTITDLETGNRYLGITGVGISELRREHVDKDSTEVRER